MSQLAPKPLEAEGHKRGWEDPASLASTDTSPTSKISVLAADGREEAGSGLVRAIFDLPGQARPRRLHSVAPRQAGV